LDSYEGTVNTSGLKAAMGG